MKIFFPASLLLAAINVGGQNLDLLSGPAESIAVFSKAKKIQVDPKRDYSIRDENKSFYSFSDEVPDTTFADLVLSTKPDVLLHPNLILRRSTARLKGDTLVVEIADVYHDFFTVSVKILKGKYQISFGYVSDVQEENRFEPRLATLTIDHTVYRPGDIVRGYLEYKGICSGPCGGMEITCWGNFKFRVP